MQNYDKDLSYKYYLFTLLCFIFAFLYLCYYICIRFSITGRYAGIINITIIISL